MQTFRKMFAISTLAFFLIACSVGDIKKLEHLPETDSDQRSGDIHVKANQVSLVNVGSANFYSVSVFLYAGATPENYFAFTLDRANVKSGYSVADIDNKKATSI